MKLPTDRIINLLLKNEQLTFLASRFLFTSSYIWNFRLNEKNRLFWRILPYTMVSYKRISFLWDLCERLEWKRIKGAYVECGVWKGGSSAVAVYMAKKFRSRRAFHLFDSWEGLPEATTEDGMKGAIYAANSTSGNLKSIKKTVADISDVKRLLFNTCKFDRQSAIYLYKGWFQTTIPAAKETIGAISLLHIDADWYRSVKYVLKELYDMVIPGGYILIDDYGQWPGCRLAVDEFIKERKIRVAIHKIDYSGVYIKKP